MLAGGKIAPIFRGISPKRVLPSAYLAWTGLEQNLLYGIAETSLSIQNDGLSTKDAIDRQSALVLIQLFEAGSNDESQDAQKGHYDVWCEAICLEHLAICLPKQ